MNTKYEQFNVRVSDQSIAVTPLSGVMSIPRNVTTLLLCVREVWG
jgi:hypothetical protein